MKAIALVAAGGAVGAVLRHLVALASLRVLGEGFPWGTLVVNVLGSFVLGWLLATTGESEVLSPDLKLMLGTGLCGALTTFSTFSVQNLVLLERQDHKLLVANVALNLLLGLAAAWAGASLRSA